MVSPSLSFLNSVFKTHNSNSKPTITQKLQNFCLLTKPSHISQLLSPPFAKLWGPPISLFQLSSSLTRVTLHEEHEIHTQTQFRHHHQRQTQIPLPSTPPTATQKIQKHAWETHNQIPHRRRRIRTMQSKKKKNRSQKNGALTRNNETTAKYKLMSSAKLLISRFTCLTIPPGLNLTSFLESPVLLSLMPQRPKSQN